MRYIELIEEISPPLLYHGTSFQNAMSIIRDGGFRGLSGHVINGKPLRGLSTSRSPRLAFLDYDPNKSPWEKKDHEVAAFNVVFILNKEAIQRHFKILPVDFFKGETKDSIFHKAAVKHADRRAENEEFVVIGKDEKLPLLGNVSKILFFTHSFNIPDTEPDYEELEELRSQALKYKIPVVVKDTDFDWYNKTRQWDMDTHKSMIANFDKNELPLKNGMLYITKSLKPLIDKWNQNGGNRLDDKQANQLFPKPERDKLWMFWFLLNAKRPKVLDKPIPSKIMRQIFEILNGVDQTNPVAYMKPVFEN